MYVSVLQFLFVSPSLFFSHSFDNTFALDIRCFLSPFLSLVLDRVYAHIDVHGRVIFYTNERVRAHTPFFAEEGSAPVEGKPCGLFCLLLLRTVESKYTDFVLLVGIAVADVRRTASAYPDEQSSTEVPPVTAE